VGSFVPRRELAGFDASSQVGDDALVLGIGSGVERLMPGCDTPAHPRPTAFDLGLSVASTEDVTRAYGVSCREPPSHRDYDRRAFGQLQSVIDNAAPSPAHADHDTKEIVAMVGHYGRDRRRRLSKEELLEQYTRAGGLCQNCGTELGANWHSAHLAAWANGGSTSQTQAWCANCNLRLGARDVEQVADVQLRQWQSQAFGPIYRRLWETGSATLHAAPGAGKTLFTGAIFRHGFDLGLFNRLLVVVPNVNLVDQWVESLGTRMRIHLDNAPSRGVVEHSETVGAVVCYQSLPNSAAAHAVRMGRTQTLVVFDEVHHVADNASWGQAVVTMVGDIANGAPENAAAVLNMTGTLFRSSKNKRISTVRYSRVEENKLQAVPDWSVPTSSLIGFELRSPDLYVYGGRAKVVDLESESIVDAEIADLGARERKAAMRQAFKNPAWLKGYCYEALRLLKNHLLAVNREVPLKLLFVADGQQEAKLAADIINRIMKRDFARLVISDEPDALRTLKRAARETEPCAIVAVQMVTEGFDCPEVSTIAHASRKAAQLFVAQEMARAMRLTDYERAVRTMLPAQILIPDDPVLKEAFAAALGSALHMVEDREPATTGTRVVPADTPTWAIACAEAAKGRRLRWRGSRCWTWKTHGWNVPRCLAMKTVMS